MIFLATVGMLAAMTLALGLFLAFVPYLMRKNECFAVTVPSSAQADPSIVSLKKRYATIMIAVTIVFTAVAAVGGVCIVQGTEQSNAMSGVGVALECAAILGLAVVSFALMLAFRKKVITLKQAKGWTTEQRMRTAVVDENDVPRPIPLAWNLLYIVVMLFTAALGFVFYPVMPDPIPMHYDFAGNADSYVEKSVASVFGFPLLTELFLAFVFLVCHAVILHSKRPSDPGAPATSALAYGLFARAQSVFLLAVGVVVSLSVGVGFMLSTAGFAAPGLIGGLIVIVCVLVVVGSIALSVIYGQAGSRLFKRMQNDDLLPDDDDEHWKLGVFYVNHDDPSVFLPKRFGIGWTINFARPAAWILMGCFFALDAVAIAAIVLATRG